MKNIWVLSVKSAVDKTGELKTSIFAYDSFEKARAATRKLLKKYAFSENDMFNGKGSLIHFDRYIERHYSKPDAFYSEELFTKEILNKVRDALKKLFSGEDTSLELQGFYTDYIVGAELDRDSVNFLAMMTAPLTDMILF